jgi:hypothetical protein
MSGVERLAELNSEALAIITRSETEVGDLEGQVEGLRAQIDLERRRLISALDELRARFYESAFADGDTSGAPPGRSISTRSARPNGPWRSSCSAAARWRRS